MSDQNIKAKSEADALDMLDLEAKKLEIELKRTELQDAQERIAERKLKREDKSSKARVNGQVLRQIADTEARTQSRCQHKKGGFGLEGIYQGSDSQRSVIKHRMFNGDIWVRCQRCGKTWKPPIEEDYYFNKAGNRVEPGTTDATFSPEAFKTAQSEYNEALNFQTLNSTSGSYTFSFSDGGKDARRKMRNTNLR